MNVVKGMVLFCGFPPSVYSQYVQLFSGLKFCYSNNLLRVEGDSLSLSPLQKPNLKLGLVANDFDPSTAEAEAGGFEFKTSVVYRDSSVALAGYSEKPCLKQNLKRHKQQHQQKHNLGIVSQTKEN